MAFCEAGAEQKDGKPKEAKLDRERVPQALEGVGIQCTGDGSGFIEFVKMDRDFRGYVRFKDFCKFIKKHRKGKAYDS